MAAKEPWYVFDEAERRREGFRNADVLVEEAAPLPAEAGPLPGDAEVLAGEAADEEVNTPAGELTEIDGAVSSRTMRSLFWPRLTYSPNVIGSLNVRPSPGEDALAEGVVFDLGEDAESGALESEVEAADGMPENSDTTVLSGIGHLPLESSTVVTLATMDVKRAVVPGVLSARGQFKVLEIVVLALAVHVMDGFMWEESSSHLELHPTDML